MMRCPLIVSGWRRSDSLLLQLSSNHGEPSPEATFRFAEPVFIDSQQNFRVEILFPQGVPGQGHSATAQTGGCERANTDLGRPGWLSDARCPVIEVSERERNHEIPK